MVACDDGLWRIQRSGSNPVFDSDEAAITFVKARAKSGSAMHAGAIMLPASGPRQRVVRARCAVWV
jgi:hypothetical protein